MQMRRQRDATVDSGHSSSRSAETGEIIDRYVFRCFDACGGLRSLSESVHLGPWALARLLSRLACVTTMIFSFRLPCGAPCGCSIGCLNLSPKSNERCEAARGVCPRGPFLDVSKLLVCAPQRKWNSASFLGLAGRLGSPVILCTGTR